MFIWLNLLHLLHSHLLKHVDALAAELDGKGPAPGRLELAVQRLLDRVIIDNEFTAVLPGMEIYEF